MSIFGSIFCANGTLLRENKDMFVLTSIKNNINVLNRLETAEESTWGYKLFWDDCVRHRVF